MGLQRSGCTDGIVATRTCRGGSASRWNKPVIVHVANGLFKPQDRRGRRVSRISIAAGIFKPAPDRV